MRRVFGIVTFAMLALTSTSIKLCAESPASSLNTSAADILAAARASRSVWTQDFPGFKADAIATIDGETRRGTMKIDASGEVELDMPESKPAEWARDQLESMVQHRRPDRPLGERRITFADSDTTNPLGRKIMLGDDRSSTYRIKDNVIREVTRGGDSTLLLISVLEVEWNANKKYLPRSFVVNYFDTKSGKLHESHAFRNDWRRMGGFDIPQKILDVSTIQGGVSIAELGLSNIELLSQRTKPQKTN